MTMKSYLYDAVIFVNPTRFTGWDGASRHQFVAKPL